MGITERKEREKEQRRNAIIDAAEKIFFTKGMDNSTMDDVAEEAELSKGTLYLYFKSKEDIQFAICMRGAAILLDMMKERVSDEKSGYENLLTMAAVSVEFSERYRDYFHFFLFFQVADLETLNIGQAQIEKSIIEESPLKLVLECVNKGIEDGSIRSGIPPDVFAATLWSQLLGVLIVGHYKSNIYRMLGVDLNDIIKTHLELVSWGGAGAKV
jgi:TetR/AcrR family transcriptional regulator